jgi:hypothetical protein
MSLTHARAISDPSDMRRHRRRFLMVCGQDTSAEARVCVSVCVRARVCTCHAHVCVCVCVCQDGSRRGQDLVFRHPDAMPRKAPFTQKSLEKIHLHGLQEPPPGGALPATHMRGLHGPLGMPREHHYAACFSLFPNVRPLPHRTSPTGSLGGCAMSEQWTNGTRANSSMVRKKSTFEVMSRKASFSCFCILV